MPTQLPRLSRFELPLLAATLSVAGTLLAWYLILNHDAGGALTIADLVVRMASVITAISSISACR